MGQLVEGSPNVIVGESGGGGSSSSGGNGGPGDGGDGGAIGGGTGGSGARGGGGGATGGGTSGGTGGGTGSTSGGGTSGGGGDPPEMIDPHQIEITVVNALDQPAIGVLYEIKLPDGVSRSGTTDSTGMIKITGIERPGDCSIVFPDVDAQAPKGGLS
jgi:hypothetical protein